MAAFVSISIHALRVEGDHQEELRENWELDFYPRPPGGGRPARNPLQRRQNEFLSTPSSCISKAPRFLSTPSGWRATLEKYLQLGEFGNFYPRPPGGGRQTAQRRCKSIVNGFLSTPSGWRATFFFDLIVSKCVCISIHALRVEGDAKTYLTRANMIYFYPRPPGGGRQEMAKKLRVSRDFYPRPPGGGRRCWIETTMFSLYFYPRPPGGGRGYARKAAAVDGVFLSTPSGH